VQTSGQPSLEAPDAQEPRFVRVRRRVAGNRAPQLVEDHVPHKDNDGDTINGVSGTADFIDGGAGTDTCFNADNYVNCP
jgi:hypothetical protein